MCIIHKEGLVLSSAVDTWKFKSYVHFLEQIIVNVFLYDCKGNMDGI